jgi:EpsI family protein
VIFGACMAILFLEMALLARVGKHKMALRDVFGIDLPRRAPAGTPRIERAIPKPFLVAIVVLAIAATAALTAPERKTFKPSREDLALMPMTLGEWHGRRDRLDQIYLDLLRPDDYLLADYVNAGREVVNIYVGYFGAQTKSSSSHSPRLCIPGGGWTITSLEEYVLPGAEHRGNPVAINRAVIKKGEDAALVYYWFKERERILTGEYVVKGYIFWDAITRNRSDGALVRLVTPVRPNEDLDKADARLGAFARLVLPELPRYLPD